MVGFEHREVDQVRAVGPRIEMREGVNLFRRRTWYTGIGGGRHVSISDAIVVDVEHRKQRNRSRRRGLDRQIGEIGAVRKAGPIRYRDRDGNKSPGRYSQPHFDPP